MNGCKVELVAGFQRARIDYLCREGAVSVFFGVPSAYHTLLSHSAQFDAGGQQYESVRIFFSAAEKLPVEIGRAWLSTFGKPIYEGYGLTETSPFATYNGGEGYREGTIGRPIAGVDVRIRADDGGVITSPLIPGELCVRGPNVMLGYWRDESATRAAFDSGWLRTGDLGQWTADNRIQIVGRIKDVINRGGLKIYPEEVERVILDVDGVEDVVVLGLPNEHVGELPVAFCVLRSEYHVTEQSLKVACGVKLPPYKIPVRFYRTGRLRYGSTGKRLRMEPEEYSSMDSPSDFDDGGGTEGRPFSI